MQGAALGLNWNESSSIGSVSEESSMKEEEVIIVLHEISPDTSDIDRATQFSARPHLGQVLRQTVRLPSRPG